MNNFLRKKEEKEKLDFEEFEGDEVEEILRACREGKPCSYGVCDECPECLRHIAKAK